MQSFRDNKGRIWELTINVATMKRVRALCNVDLYKVIDDGGEPRSELLTKLYNDPILLVDVIYAVCKPAADRLAVSDIDFGEAMAGDAVDAAANALLDELVGFFPTLKSQAFSKALQATRRFMSAKQQQLRTMLADPELDKRLDSELARLDASSSNTQASSESIPAR